MHTCKAEHMQSRLQLQIVAMSQQAIYRERNFCISSGKQFAISLIDWFYFNGVILTVIVLDALCIGIQASEFATTRTGNSNCIEQLALIIVAIITTCRVVHSDCV